MSIEHVQSAPETVETELFRKIDIKNERPGGLLDAMVPVELIDRTEVPVDQSHVQELADSMVREMENGTASGILTPILLAHTPGKSLFSIIDGFHRDSASALIGSEEIYATVRPNTSEDEILDLRIMTARNHKSVSFARTNEWVIDAWERTPWAERGFTATQAFGLTSNKKMNGKYLGLSPEEATEIRAWATDKCQKWNVSPQSIYSAVVTASLADPELVDSVRGRASGHELKHLTPQHLADIARAFPHRFEEQNIITTLVLENKLSIEHTKQVLELVKGIDLTDDVQDMIQQTNWDALLVEKKKGRPTKASKTEKGDFNPAEEVLAEEDAGKTVKTGPNYMPQNEHKVRRQLVIAETRLAQHALENSVLRGAYRAAPLNDPYQGAFSIMYGPSSSELDEALHTHTTDKTVDEFLTVFERSEATLKKNLIEQLGLDEALADRVLLTASTRITSDLDTGALQYVDLSNPRPFIDLIRNTVHDEASRLKSSQPGNSLHAVPQNEHTLEAAEYLLPTLHKETRTTLAMIGLMGVGAYPTGQVLRVDTQKARDYADIVGRRLAAIDAKLEEASA